MGWAEVSVVGEVEFMTPADLVHRAIAEIIKKVNFTLGEISNEAELQYCVGDPILDALCDAWGYKAKLEETVRNQKDHHLPVSFLRILLFQGLCEHLLVATKPPCLLITGYSYSITSPQQCLVSGDEIRTL